MSRHGTIRIAVEGNIAAGKSTFLDLVHKYTHIKTLQEPVNNWTNVPLERDCVSGANNNLLDTYYSDPARWSFTFQNYVVFSRIREHQSDKENKRQGVFLSERSIWGDRLVFARNLYKQGMMTDLEYSVYCQQHSFCLELCPEAAPDAILYLQTSPEICLERLKQRGRSEEMGVTLEYLQQVHQRHEEWLVQKSVHIPRSLAETPVMIIDCSRNFTEDTEYREETFRKLVVFANSLNRED